MKHKNLSIAVIFLLVIALLSVLFLVIFSNKVLPASADNKISEQINRQMSHVLKEEKISLPKNYSVLNYCTGDLNSDGRNDVAVLIEHNGLKKKTRTIYIYLQNSSFLKRIKEKYQFKYKNSKILSYSDCSSYEFPLKIEKGQLCVTFGYRYEYQFKLKGNKLLLTNIAQYYINNTSLKGIVTYYDLEKSKFETRFWNEINEECNKPYDKLLLYSGTMDRKFTITFADASVFFVKDLKPEWQPLNYFLKTQSYVELGWQPIPNFAGVGNFEVNDYNSLLKHSAQECLDKIQKKHYPHMKKIEFTCSEKIKKNYSTLLGYRMPDYYYSDGTNTLYYCYLADLNGFQETRRLLHVIFYDNLINKKGESYGIYDDTGKEDTEEQ